MRVPLTILSCDGCGLCCYLQAYPPFMPTERDALPAHLLAELPAEGEAAAGTGPCSWLTADKRCRHYLHRPEVCRQFEMGEKECLEIRGRMLK